MKLENFIRKFGHERIKESISNNKNRNDISINLFGYTKGDTTLILKEYIETYDIDTTHFDKQWRNRKYEKIIKKVCPQCNKEFETSGKDNNTTCSYKCSNIYFADKRKVDGFKDVKCCDCSELVTVKLQTDPKRVFCKECFPKHAKNICKNCGKVLRRKTKWGLCKKCLPKDPEYIKQAIRIGKEIAKRSSFKGWATRTKLKPSYPEQYFMDVFKEEDIDYIREKKIGKYFADFVINDRIVLEVDGKQHRQKRRMESDIKKDAYLTKNGYTVYRIQWFVPYTKNGRKKLYRQIREFYDIIKHESNYNLGA